MRERLLKSGDVSRNCIQVKVLVELDDTHTRDGK